MWFYDQKLPFRDRPLFFRLDAPLVISEVVLGSFWLMLPGLGPNR